MTDFLDVVNRMGLVVIHASGGHLLVEGDVELSGSDIATLPDNLSIIGSLIARECARLSALPAGLNIMNSLDLRNTPITSLPADIAKRHYFDNSQLYFFAAYHGISCNRF